MRVYVTFTDNEGIGGHDVAKYKKMGFDFDNDDTVYDKSFEFETLEEYHSLIEKLGQCIVWVTRDELTVEVYNDYRE